VAVAKEPVTVQDLSGQLLKVLGEEAREVVMTEGQMMIDQWRAEKKFPEFLDYDRIEAYKGFGGIRNEEDAVITADGYRILGKKKPLTIEEVESVAKDLAA
jgi:Xaa-Pro aminopeptidase